MDQEKKECNMKPDEYEQLVREILEELYPQFSDKPIKIIDSGQSSQIEGASGFTHQIDIQIENEECIFLIECKCWNSNVPVEKILAFYGRIFDIQKNRHKKVIGVIATTKGYQEGVPILAKFFKIDLGVFNSVRQFSMRIVDLTMLRATDVIHLIENTEVKIAESDDHQSNK